MTRINVLVSVYSRSPLEIALSRQIPSRERGGANAPPQAGRDNLEGAMTNRHTFEATYRGFPVELMIETYARHPKGVCASGVRVTGSYFGTTWPIIISPEDAQKIGEMLTAASQGCARMQPEPAGEG